MASEKRRRQRRNQQMRELELERVAQHRKRRRNIVRGVIVVVMLAAAALLYSVLSSDDPDTEAVAADADASAADADAGAADAAVATEDAAGATVEPGASPSTTAPPATTSPAATAAPSPDDAPTGTSAGTSTDAPAAQTPTAATAVPDERCPAPDGSDARVAQFSEPPPVCIDAGRLYAADFETTLGEFTLVLDPALDLASVNNFVFLSRFGAYDDTIFHRVIQGFVVQGGDVEMAFGTGSPGYRFDGGYPVDGWYSVGAVAMANSGDPTSNGSQFFIVTSDTTGLPPNYSPLGRVTAGLDAVLAIEATPTGVRERPGGSPARDVPVADVVVTSVTIRDAGDADLAAYARAAG